MRGDADAYGEGRNSSMSMEAGGLGSLKSPTPYLFGGLAFMLLLIASALLILACSFRQYSSSSHSHHNKQGNTTVDMDGDDEGNSEPKIVVIMAGDTNPTYLANPLSSSSSLTLSQHSASTLNT